MYISTDITTPFLPNIPTTLSTSTIMSHPLSFTFAPSTTCLSSTHFISSDAWHGELPLSSRPIPRAATRATRRKRLRTPSSNITTTCQSFQTRVHNSINSSTPNDLNPSIEALSAQADAADWNGIIHMYQTISKKYKPSELPQRLYTHVFFALMKLGGFKYAQMAWRIWSRAISTNSSSLNQLFSPRSFNFLHVLLSRSSMVDEALQVRQRCHQCGYYLNRYSYNAFLNACAKTGRVDDAFETFRDMAENNVSPDVVSCNVLISCCVKSGDVDIALTVLERMRKWGIPPDIYSYNSVVNGLRKNKMLDDAFALVRHMEQEADLEEKRQEELARKLSQKDSLNDEGEKEDHQGEDSDVDSKSMQSSEYTVEGRNASTKSDPQKKYITPVSPDLVTYNTLISGIASLTEPDFERALAVKKHMETRGLQCNEVTYNSLMAVAARADRPEDAFDIYDDMLSQNLIPNCECYTTLITMCGRVGLTTRAFELHEHMRESGIRPSVVTFNSLLTVCRRSEGREAGDAALQVLSEMRRTPGCEPDVITYSTIIDSLGKGGRFDEVLDVLNEMTESGILPNLVTYTSIVSAFVRAGDLPGAMNVLKEMERNGIEPNVYTFSSLINGAGRLGELMKALEILQMMRKKNIHANRITYSALAQLACRSGKWDHVIMVIDQLLQDNRLIGTVYEERLLSLRDDQKAFMSGRRRAVTQDLLDVIADCFPEKRDNYSEKKHFA